MFEWFRALGYGIGAEGNVNSEVLFYSRVEHTCVCIHLPFELSHYNVNIQMSITNMQSFLLTS